jgi:hypothetical protein
VTALPPGWHDFYVLVGGSAATLTGLMFIAISLGTGRWAARDRPLLDAAFGAFLSPTFIHFVYVLITAIVLLVPTITATVLGVLLVLVGLGSLGHTARNLPFFRERFRRGTVDRSDLVWYSLMPSIAYALYLIGGVGLLRAARGLRAPHALDLLAAASILLLAIGVRNAWDLVVFFVLRQADETGGDRP